MQNSASLKRSVLSAVGWGAATRFLAQLLNWGMTLIVIRFLQPADYGLMAMTMAVIGFLQSMSYAGTADAIVQNRNLDEEALRNIFGLVILINSILLVILCVGASPIARFYHEPRLVPLLYVASLTFIAVTVQAIPRATLDKRLDLKRASRVELAANLASGVAVLAMAMASFGVWSLVVGSLVNSAVRAGGFFILAPYWRTPRFRFSGIRDVIRITGLRTAESVLWTIYISSDVFVIGKLLGPELLGVYSLGRQIAGLPVEKLAVVLKPVAFPAFALIQDQPEEAFHYLQKAIRLIGLITFPLFLGLSALAPEIVTIALGPQWITAEMPIELLSIAMVLRPVSLILPSFLFGIGHFRASFNNTLLSAILFPVIFSIGSHWGLLGVCIASALAYSAQFLILIRRIALVSNKRVTALFSPIAAPLAAAILMYAGLMMLDHTLPVQEVWARSLWLVVTGFSLYAAFTMLFCRSYVNEFFSLIAR